MLRNQTEYNQLTPTSFTHLLYKWKLVLLVVTLISILTGIIFSGPMFITPKYKSEVILYPSSSNAVSKALVNTSFVNKNDILEFGADEQTEQMLQIFQSSRIRNIIKEQFQLEKHYNIQEDSRYKQSKFNKAYNNNVNFKKTQYMAIQITVYDKSADTAALIANNIAALYDSIKKDIQQERAMKALSIVEREYFQLKSDIKIMEDSLSQLRMLGVHDYESQAEMFNRQLAIELAKNNRSGIKLLEHKLDILGKYGSAYVSLRDGLEYEAEKLSLLKGKYDEAKIDAYETLPQKFIVDQAYASERKAYPIRWLIVLSTCLSCLVVTCFTLIVMERISEHKNRISK
ncbi:MAG: hypothetical protein JEZ03_04810 [Bacteroidales bacterium]|nr:hypothetical protein [Bacteroidales bacterium]